MASGGLWKSNVCPECGMKVEILNNDINYSMNLHFQSHKSIETINHEIDQKMKNIRIGPKKSNKGDYSCPECKEIVVIVNNDISLSLKLHAQRHRSAQGEGRTEDQSSVTSGKSKGSDSKVKAAVPNPNLQMPPPPVAPVSILEGVFESMAPGLKMHKGFVSENEKGKVSCDVCKVAVDSVFSISDHLKTKSHEDKTIAFLTNILPSELHQAMEFVSFYGSNLCCNLCRGRIDLNSNNPHETIVAIISHNSSKSHLKTKGNDDSNSNTDGAVVILKSLAKLNPIVDSNKHLIECKMEPQFRCKLCDKTIIYEENESLLYKNFYSHFTSKGHVKCSEAFSVLEAFNLSHFPGKERHNLSALRGGIYCTVCHCPVEVNLQQLIDHVKNAPGSIPATIGEHDSQLKNDTTLPQEKGAPGNVKQNLKSILASVQPHLRNTKCIVEDEKGQFKCVTCNMVIPPSSYNIQTHLLGKSHKNKSSKVKTTDKEISELTESSILLKNLFALVPFSLQTHFKFIQAVSKERVHCSVCNFQVPAQTKCLEEHLGGAAHKKAVENFKLSLAQEMKIVNDPSKGDLLETLTKSNIISKNFAKYIIPFGDHYKCKICESKVPKSNDEQTLKDNIINHINGQKHQTAISKVQDELLQKLEMLNPAIKTDKQFLQKQPGGLFCSLCSCTMSLSTDFDSFKSTLLTHLTGSNHTNKKAKLSEAKAASTPTYPPGNQNVDPMKSQFFQSHPFKDDIAFLKSSSVAGYLSCTLCNTIVNPMYLREHLEDVNHIHKKSFVQRSMPFPNVSDDQDVARNLESMISLLGNIDKKLSWQNN